jgi:hypothetical protein
VVYDFFLICIMSVLDLSYSLCYLVFIQYVNVTSYFVGINHGQFGFSAVRTARSFVFYVVLWGLLLVLLPFFALPF